MRPQILLVEDDPDSRALIALQLEANNFRCVAVDNGPDAVTIARQATFDLIVLDVSLPGLDGLAVCRAIRRSTAGEHTPILMVTAHGHQSDISLGLASGADDYLTKPFGVQEFVARVQALLRRAGLPRREVSAPGRIAAHGLELDYARRAVRVQGLAVATTKQEFLLLYLLASHPGIVFTRRRILQKLWREDRNGTERSVDALVKRVRRKIEGSGGREGLIQTVWGEGYKFPDL